MTASISSHKRSVLFRSSRPLVRKYEQKDAGFLWAAYLNKSFDIPEGLSQEQFLVAVAAKFGGFNLLWMIEDDNQNFKSGRGQIAIVGIKTDGWAYEPHSLFFRWATPKNILRACVAFFQMIRHQKDVGVCLVKSIKKDVKLLKTMERYGVLYLRGRIPYGSPLGDVYLFSIDGKQKTRISERTNG